MRKYEMNVAQRRVTRHGSRWVHHCRIDLGDVPEKEAARKAREIEALFKTLGNFECSLTEWTERGVVVEFKEN